MCVELYPGGGMQDPISKAESRFEIMPSKGERIPNKGRGFLQLF